MKQGTIPRREDVVHGSNFYMKNEEKVIES